MEDELPPLMRDYRLETQFPKKRVVVHVYDDGNSVPECWKSERRPIGSGRQGTIYLQICTDGIRRYTYRVVKMIVLQETSGRRHYLRELQIVARFSHDRVRPARGEQYIHRSRANLYYQYSRYFVRSLGWYLSSNTLCIAMEYLAKGDLEIYLRNRPPLREIEYREIIRQVTKALQLMHQEGYAHRDIKPQVR
jgi:serine/threonine protein kinase